MAEAAPALPAPTIAAPDRLSMLIRLGFFQVTAPAAVVLKCSHLPPSRNGAV